MNEAAADTPKMNWLWTEEKLLKLLAKKKHQSVIVGWVLDQLKHIAPGTAYKEAVNLLNSKSELVVMEVVRFVKEFPDWPDPEPLKQFYLNNDTSAAGELCERLAEHDIDEYARLFREKYPDGYKEGNFEYLRSLSTMAFLRKHLARPVIEAVAQQALSRLENGETVSNAFKTIIISTLLHAVTFDPGLLKRCLAQPGFSIQIENVAHFTAAVCRVNFHSTELSPGDNDEDHDSQSCECENHECGNNECDHDDCDCGHEDDDDLNEIEKNFESLMENGYAEQADDWKEALENEKFCDVVTGILRELRLLLDQKEAEYGPEVFNQWKDLSGDIPVWASVIEALGSVWDLAPDRMQRDWAVVMIKIFDRLASVKHLVGKPLDQFDIDTLSRTFFQNRDNLPIDFAIKKILRTAPHQEPLIDECVKVLENDVLSGAANRAVVYLASLGSLKLVKKVIPLIADHPGLWDEIRVYAELGPADWLTIAGEVLENKTNAFYTAYGLMFLQRLPVEEAVGIIIDRWEEFWCFDKGIVLDCIEELGDQRFIRYLKTEWREGELKEGRLIQMLCQINGVKDAVLKKVDTDVKHWEKFLRRNKRIMEEFDLKNLNKMPLLVDAICLNCRREFNYPVKDIHLIEAPLEALIRDIMVCKFCGSVDSFNIDGGFMETVTDYLDAMWRARHETGQQLDENDLDQATVKLTDAFNIEGRRVGSMEMVEYYQAKCKEDPGNARSWYELANSFQIVKKAVYAVQCYQNCLKSEPVAVDAYIPLALIALENGDYEEAYNIFEDDIYPIMDVGKYFGDEVTPANVRQIIAPPWVEAASQIKRKVPNDIAEIFEQVIESYRGQGY